MGFITMFHHHLGKIFGTLSKHQTVANLSSHVVGFPGFAIFPCPSFERFEDV